MILWLVCLATLAAAAWCDWHWRRIPLLLPVVPVAAATILWPHVEPIEGALVTLGLIGLTVLVLVLAEVGVGDVALSAAVGLSLGVWVLVVLAVALLAGLLTLTRRRRPDDPFVPHLLAGFLLASGLRWVVGG